MPDLLWTCTDCYSGENHGSDWSRLRLFVNDNPTCPRCGSKGSIFLNRKGLVVRAEDCPAELIDVLERQDSYGQTV